MENPVEMAARDNNNDGAGVLHVASEEGPGQQEKDNPTANPGATAPPHDQTQESKPMENPAGMAAWVNDGDSDAEVLHVAPEEGPAKQEKDHLTANPRATAPRKDPGISAQWTPEEQAVLEEELAGLILGPEHQDNRQIHRQDHGGDGAALEVDVPEEGGGGAGPGEEGQGQGQQEGELVEWTPEVRAVLEERLAEVILELECYVRRQIHRHDRAGGGASPEVDSPEEGGGGVGPGEEGQEHGQQGGETAELPLLEFNYPENNYTDSFSHREILGHFLRLNDILLTRISENTANLRVADNTKLFKLVRENLVGLKDEIAKIPFSTPMLPPPLPPM